MSGNPYAWPPVPMPAMRAGETDGRYVDTTYDLGAAGDAIPSVAAVEIIIARADNIATDASDLQLAGDAWQNTLDPTGLILTIGLIAPPTAAGRLYYLTIKVAKTVAGRVYIRDVSLAVTALLG